MFKNILDYIGLITRFQTLQTLGFVLSGVALIVFMNSCSRKLEEENWGRKTVGYLTLIFVGSSILLGIYPDVASVFTKYSLSNDPSGVLAISKKLFLIYLSQLGIAILALISAFIGRPTHPTSVHQTEHPGT